jgi:hypothetical protein
MKTRFLSYALLGILTIGASGVAVFAQTQPSTTEPTTEAQAMQDPAITGTIPLPDTSTEAGEAAQYQSLAKVTMQDAITAAQTATGLTSTPSLAALGNENGFLVWEIVIGDQEVKVDAGDGKVLHQAAVGGEEMNDGENSSEDTGEMNGENDGENNDEDGGENGGESDDN